MRQYQYDDSVADEFEREPFSVKVHSTETGKCCNSQGDRIDHISLVRVIQTYRYDFLPNCRWDKNERPNC